MELEQKHTAFLFPGQGSQKVGMGKDLAMEFQVANDIFNQADLLLSEPIKKLCWEGPEDDLNDTYNTQPALLTHSIAAIQVFYQLFPGFKPAFMAGHSMGEFSALVAANALSFPETLNLVRRRGELMRSAGNEIPGGMAAILGLDIQTVDNICQESSTDKEIIQVANDNCPGQVVISGTLAALDRAILLAQTKGARKVSRLAVSIASHSPLMDKAQEKFSFSVANAKITDPQIPIIGNVSVTPLLTAEDIKKDLQAQLISRVRWTETILYMIDHGIKLFIELGSGSVLTSLLKRINKDVIGLSLSTPQDFEKIRMGEV